MSKKLFSNDDIFINRLKMHPEFSFFIYNSKVYINNDIHISSPTVSNILNTKNDGHTSLFEMNINRANNLIYAFVESGSNNQHFDTSLYGDFGTITQGSQINYTSSYPLSASIYRKYTSTEQFTATHINNDTTGEPVGTNQTNILRNLTGSALYYLGKNKYATHSWRFLAAPMTASNFNVIDIP